MFWSWNVGMLCILHRRLSSRDVLEGYSENIKITWPNYLILRSQKLSLGNTFTGSFLIIKCLHRKYFYVMINRARVENVKNMFSCFRDTWSHFHKHRPHLQRHSAGTLFMSHEKTWKHFARVSSCHEKTFCTRGRMFLVFSWQGKTREKCVHVFSW